VPGRPHSPIRRAAMPGPAEEERGRMDGEANRVRIPGEGSDAVYWITAFGQRVEGVDLENTVAGLRASAMTVQRPPCHRSMRGVAGEPKSTPNRADSTFNIYSQTLHGRAMPGRLYSLFRKIAMLGPTEEEIDRMDREDMEANRVRPLQDDGYNVYYGITAFGQRVEDSDEDI